MDTGAETWTEPSFGVAAVLLTYISGYGTSDFARREYEANTYMRTKRTQTLHCGECILISPPS